MVISVYSIYVAYVQIFCQQVNEFQKINVLVKF